MNYAVIKTGGKQYRVSEGDVIAVEKLALQPGDNVVFPEILMLKNGDSVTLGAPIVDGLTVSGKVLEQFRHDKIRVSQYKAKVRHRRVVGHRQHLTRVQIEAIGSKKQAEKEAPARKAAAKKAPAKAA